MRLLVTAGPTREHFDDVRFISNASSGRLGHAIANEAARRGHAVVLISGPVELPALDNVEFVSVVAAREMLDACIEHFETCDAAVMCAAVCDYRPTGRLRGKAPKTAKPHAVTLEPTEDICASLGRMKTNRVLVGFALETQQAHARAEAKLRRKNCDAIVLNHPAGIGKDETTIEVYVAGEGWSPPQSACKTDLAAHLVGLVERLAAR